VKPDNIRLWQIRKKKLENRSFSLPELF